MSLENFSTTDSIPCLQAAYNKTYLMCRRNCRYNKIHFKYKSRAQQNENPLLRKEEQTIGPDMILQPLVTEGGK